MGKSIMSDKADFGLIDSYAKRYEVPGRTKSAAFLIWFLETIYRLDETDAQDAVCDRSLGGSESRTAAVVSRCGVPPRLRASKALDRSSSPMDTRSGGI